MDPAALICVWGPTVRTSYTDFFLCSGGRRSHGGVGGSGITL